MKKQYECILNYKGNQLTVNVYAINRKRLKYKAIDAAMDFLDELGLDHINIEEIEPIGFIDKGIWAA